MATVREGVMRLPAAAPARHGETVRVPVGLAGLDLPTEVLESQRRPRKVNLKAARIIVAGGAGVGSRENFRLILDLANILRGAVGGSRAAVDLGYVDHDHQVGQTGTTVRPALYICCGISGAVQHTAGLGQPDHVISVNVDPHCPMMELADLAVVADANETVAELHRRLGGGAEGTDG